LIKEKFGSENFLSDFSQVIGEKVDYSPERGFVLINKMFHQRLFSIVYQ